MEGALLAAAGVLLGGCLWAYAEADIYRWVSDARLAPLLRSGWTGDPGFRAVRTRREASTDGLVGWIEIPRLGLSAVVAEGSDPVTLRRAAGHVRGTAFPGEGGNVVVAAHRDGLFRPLQDARPHDRITLRTPDGTFRYVVEWTAVVAPSRTDLLGPSSGHDLTLLTCYPFAWIGPAPSRFVVRARLQPPTEKGAFRARLGRSPPA